MLLFSSARPTQHPFYSDTSIALGLQDTCLYVRYMDLSPARRSRRSQAVDGHAPGAMLGERSEAPHAFTAVPLQQMTTNTRYHSGAAESAHCICKQQQGLRAGYGGSGHLLLREQAGAGCKSALR